MPKLTRTLRPALLALLLIGLVPLAQAQWKWRDASGKVQYSDLPPPPGVSDKDILQRPASAQRQVVVRPVGQAADSPAAPASAPSAARAASKADAEQQAKQKAQEAEAAKRQKEEAQRLAEQRAENCRRASAQLRLLDDGVRVSKRNEAGETIYLNDAQRAEEARHARAVMASDCR